MTVKLKAAPKKQKAKAKPAPAVSKKVVKPARPAVTLSPAAQALESKIAKIIQRLEHYEKTVGPRFAPSAALRNLAK